ncbi:MAG: large-conductance mechanosensitive channel protein MscL [Methylobacter sp.]
MGVLQEFKEFAIKGNAVDMAVGIIVGAAFGKIISSLVADVLMPPIGLLVGGVDFTKLAVTLKEASANTPAVTLNYGNFIQTLVDFTIVTSAIFMVVKLINRLKKKEAAVPVAAPKLSQEEQLLTEIRDLLRERKN